MRLLFVFTLWLITLLCLIILSLACSAVGLLRCDELLNEIQLGQDVSGATSSLVANSLKVLFIFYVVLLLIWLLGGGRLVVVIKLLLPILGLFCRRATAATKLIQSVRRLLLMLILLIRHSLTVK